MRGKTRTMLAALAALIALSALGGCIIVPDDDYYDHRHRWDHDGDWHGHDHDGWR